MKDVISEGSLERFHLEYAGAELGDERRSARLLSIASAAVSDPTASFRQSASDDAALEGTYRFLNNWAVEAEDIWGPHERRTRARGQEHTSVLALHDTTQMKFCGETERRGLGHVRKDGGAAGFFLHVGLMVAEDRERTPLGVGRFETWTRHGKAEGKRGHRFYRQDPLHEGHRWVEGIRDIEARFCQGPKVVHVMDREGDGYALLAEAHRADWSVVVRMCTDRATTEPKPAGKGHVRVRAQLQTAERILERDVELSRRGRRGRTPAAIALHPPRKTRTSRLSVRALTVELLRPTSVSTELPSALLLNAVQVLEVAPPHGQAPVEWTLLTTLPIGTAKEVERIVDLYRTRWLIEEYFKALKTGCAFEKRQHDNLHALRNALAIFLPIAWRMLALRTLARSDSTTPANRFLTSTQLQVLRALARKPMPSSPTVTDALWALASLAGHFHRRTRPGWQCLAHAFEKLLIAEIAWTAAIGTQM